MRVALLANIPAPYRVPVYDRIAAKLGDGFRVLYMQQAAAALPAGVRGAAQPLLHHDHSFLRGMTIVRGRRDVQLRHGAVRELHRFAPDVVLTGSFNPPMLAAWLYARARGIPHIAISDAWLGSEHRLGAAHRWIRHRVYGSSSAFVGASEKTLALFRHYGATDRLYLSPLCIDNARFAAAATRERDVDLVFSGKLIDDKLPLFFADVARRVAARRGHVSVLVLGDGELRAPMERALAADGVSVTMAGYLPQDALPTAYARGKLLLFPSRMDAWGIVANEGCAAGLPVFTTEHAGCAGELVRSGDTGYVLPLDAAVWADHAVRLLDEPTLIAQMSARAIAAVARYTFDAAATGVLAACTACA